VCCYLVCPSASSAAVEDCDLAASSVAFAAAVLNPQGIRGRQKFLHLGRLMLQLLASCFTPEHYGICKAWQPIVLGCLTAGCHQGIIWSSTVTVAVAVKPRQPSVMLLLDAWCCPGSHCVCPCQFACAFRLPSRLAARAYNKKVPTTVGHREAGDALQSKLGFDPAGSTTQSKQTRKQLLSVLQDGIEQAGAGQTRRVIIASPQPVAQGATTFCCSINQLLMTNKETWVAEGAVIDAALPTLHWNNSCKAGGILLVL